MMYCKFCKENVIQCWDSSSGCYGGGHCVLCGGYNFETEEETEDREANEILTKILVNDVCVDTARQGEI